MLIVIPEAVRHPRDKWRFGTEPRLLEYASQWEGTGNTKSNNVQGLV